MAERQLSIRLSVTDADKVKAALTSLGKDGEAALRRLELSGQPASRGLLAINAASRDLQGSLAGMAGRLGPVGSGLSAMGAGGVAAAAGLAALIAGVGTLIGATRDAVTYGAAINDVAQQTGVAAEALQQWRYALAQGGVEINETDQALAKLNQKIGDAAGGSREARAVFEALGIAIRDASGDVRPVTDVLSDVADRLSRIEDPAQRAAAAADLFGRGISTKMVGALAEGSEALGGLRDEARTAGAVISEQLVAKAAQLDDQLAALALTVKAQTTEALVEAGPALVAFDSAIGNLKIRLAEFAGELIQGAPIVGSYFEAIAEFALTAFIAIERDVSAAAQSLFSAFSGASEGVAYGIAQIGQTIQGLIELVRATMNAIIGLFVGAFDGVVAAWNSLPAAFRDIIVRALNGVIAGIEYAVNQVADALNSIIGIANAAAQLMGETLFDPIRPVALGRIKNEYEGAGAATAMAFADAFVANMNRDWIGEAFVGLGLAAQSFIDNMVQGIDTAFSRLQSRAAELRGEFGGASAFQRDGATLPTGSATAAPAPRVTTPPLSYVPATGGGGGGGGGGSAAAAAQREQTAALADYIAKLQEETIQAGMSADVAEKRRAIVTASTAAQRDFEAKLRSTNQLTAEEIAIISQAVDIQHAYRDAAEETAAAQQENAQIAEQVGSSFKTFFSDIVSGSKSAAEAVMDLANAIINLAAQKLIMEPLGQLFSGLAGSILGSAKGNVFAGGNVMAFAQGGVVSAPTLFPMANGGIGLMGEAGEEGVLPLKRDRDGRLGVIVAAQRRGRDAGGEVSFHLYDQRTSSSSKPVEVQEGRDAFGRREIKAWIRDEVDGQLASGQHDRRFADTFGLRRQGRR